MRKIILISILFLATVVGCTEKTIGNSISPSPDVVEPLDANNDSTDNGEDIEVVDPSTVYPFYGNECVECRWYFCPPLDSIWQKQICIDYCEEPPEILY